jgi:hypothetical protein
MKDEEYDKMANFRSTRLPVEYSAEYRLGNMSGEGLITDISSGGVALRVKQSFALGDQLFIKSRISSDLVLEFSGEVRNTEGNMVGIKILDIDPSIHERFTHHIEGLLRIANKRNVEKFNLKES